MRIAGRFLLGAALSVVLVGAMASPVSAADSNGCSGSASSTKSSGEALDTVNAPDASTGTESRPFKVAYDGRVKWEGATDGVIKPGTWEVKVGPGITISDSFDNDEGKQASSGDEKVSDRLPVKITGLYKVEVSVTGTGGSCTGSGWILMADSPLFTPLWFGGLAFLLIGGVLFFLGMPTRGRVV